MNDGQQIWHHLLTSQHENFKTMKVKNSVKRGFTFKSVAYDIKLIRS
jgi:hypothetical protein